jgi:hypothetical protein
MMLQVAITGITINMKNPSSRRRSAVSLAASTIPSIHSRSAQWRFSSLERGVESGENNPMLNFQCCVLPIRLMLISMKDKLTQPTKTLRIKEQRDKEWNIRYEELKEYVVEHDHDNTLVIGPNHWETGFINKGLSSRRVKRATLSCLQSVCRN